MCQTSAICTPSTDCPRNWYPFARYNSGSSEECHCASQSVIRDGQAKPVLLLSYLFLLRPSYCWRRAGSCSASQEAQRSAEISKMLWWFHRKTWKRHQVIRMRMPFWNCWNCGKKICSFCFLQLRLWTSCWWSNISAWLQVVSQWCWPRPPAKAKIYRLVREAMWEPKFASSEKGIWTSRSSRVGKTDTRLPKKVHNDYLFITVFLFCFDHYRSMFSNNVYYFSIITGLCSRSFWCLRIQDRGTWGRPLNSNQDISWPEYRNDKIDRCAQISTCRQ